ncbi:GAF and ANTAR domain-containing protein [Mycobacterium sp. AMU20-3851]|uniref:GAF and ANTAR domain-containing protein n=1 Tax=Mycobacterium sp. AMU20-3851 TaxID=3122055 RepID=UPI0037545180
MDRYHKLARAVVGLADTMVADFDLIELAQQLIETAMALLPVDAAGIVLADENGDLQVLASSSEQSSLLELFQTQQDNGPCMLAYRGGRPYGVDDLRIGGRRWPQFASRSVELGFLSVYALPMRLRSDRIGALNLLRSATGPLSDSDMHIAQALADMATIGILHQRTAMRLDLLNRQLQTALHSRTVIEQAKGVLAARRGIDVHQAFNLLRSHARSTNTRLVDVARAVVEGADPG